MAKLLLASLAAVIGMFVCVRLADWTIERCGPALAQAAARAAVVMQPVKVTEDKPTRPEQSRIADSRGESSEAEVLPQRSETAGQGRDSERAANTRAKTAGVSADRTNVRGPHGRTEGKAGGRIPDQPRAKQLQGLRVAATTVLALAERGARPGARLVAASQKRPGGLMLFNVSGLGVGLRDGDVLTHVFGQPVQSEAQVVGLVLQARGRQAKTIVGRIWRDQASFPISVEQPYLAVGQGEGSSQSAMSSSAAILD